FIEEPSSIPVNVHNRVHAGSLAPSDDFLHPLHLVSLNHARAGVSVPGNGHTHRLDASASNPLNEVSRNERLAPPGFPNRCVFQSVADVGAKAHLGDQFNRIDWCVHHSTNATAPLSGSTGTRRRAASRGCA